MAEKSGNLRATESAAESPYAEGVVGSIAPASLTHGSGDGGGDGTPRHKAPTLDDIQRWAKADQEYWASRNKRMLRHQERFLLKKKPWTSRKPDSRVYLNDCKVVIEKIASMIARREPRIEVPPRSEATWESAQRIENALRWWNGCLNRRWQEGLHNPLPYDQAQSLLLRGWLCERILLNPDDECWVDDVMFEPMNIYPRIGGKRIKRVCHVYQATVGEIIEEFPDAEARFLGQDEDRKLSCIGFYDNREPYYHAVIAEGEFVKKPDALGYWPWLIAVAKGAFSHHEYPGAQPGDATENIGAGFLDSIEDVLDALQRFLSMLTAAAAKQENPPIAIYTGQEGDIRQVEVGEGDTSHLITGDKVEVFEIGAKVGTLTPILSVLDDRTNKGGLPAAMYGQGTSLASGFLGALLMGAAEDVVWAFIMALSVFQSLRNEKILSIYAQYADRDLPVLAPAMEEAGGIPKGKAAWLGRLSPSDIQANGTYVDVVYEDISPQDRVGLGNLAVMLVREKLVDLETARDKYLGLDDPGLINDRVLKDLAYLSEDVVKARSKIELAKRGMWPELIELLKAEMRKEQQEQVPPGGAPPMPPSGPSGGPSPVGGMPPEALPPALMGQEQPVPSEGDLAAMMAAGGG